VSLPSRLFNKVARKLGLSSGFSSEELKNRQVVSIAANVQPAKGRVLLSYVLDPFVDPSNISNAHTHFWESFTIGQSFVARGYDLDVIHFENHSFMPAHDYDFFISARTNFDSIHPRLNSNCVTIVHLDTAHWLYNNAAAYKRLQELWVRRGVALVNAKELGANWALENADMGTVLGNTFTLDTYGYANKPLFRIPISAPLTYDWDDTKNIDSCRNRYLWFGSSGFVHKGLDLALEAFAGMPDKELVVCGPMEQEHRFCQAYRKELYDTPNVETIGWVDVAGEEFMQIARRCIGMVYPTCSEGGGGSVITCMHAGVIPIVTEQASVDVDGSGVVLDQASIASIQRAVNSLSGMSEQSLHVLRRGAWEQARSQHTREHFAENFQQFVDEQLLANKT